MSNTIYHIFSLNFRLKNQIPDLERSLDMIKLLKKHKTESSGEKLVTQFLLSEQLYSKATINPSDTVYLWLGVSCAASVRSELI